MALAAIALLLLPPILALLGALFRGLILFLPVMWILGWLHNYIETVPNLGWKPSFLLVALLSLLIPTGGTTSD